MLKHIKTCFRFMLFFKKLILMKALESRDMFCSRRNTLSKMTNVIEHVTMAEKGFFFVYLPRTLFFVVSRHPWQKNYLDKPQLELLFDDPEMEKFCSLLYFGGRFFLKYELLKIPWN